MRTSVQNQVIPFHPRERKPVNKIKLFMRGICVFLVIAANVDAIAILIYALCQAIAAASLYLASSLGFIIFATIITVNE